jgi:MFS family permease
VLISTEGDITVPAGDHVDAVVVVNGTATVAGEVNTIVVVDGSIVLSGTTETIVAVRTPVSLGPDSVVTQDVMKVDSLVTKTGNARIQGTIRDIGTEMTGVGFFLGPVLILLYVGFALAAIVAALLLAALAARQVRAAEEIISREPIQTFATGFIGAIAPAILIFGLFVTVVGAPLALGILFGLWPAVAFVGYLVAGIWVGDWILRRTSPETTRERPYLAAVIGLIVLQVLGIWPFVTMIAAMFGYGAVLILAWRTFRRSGPRVQDAPRTATRAPQPS